MKFRSPHFFLAGFIQLIFCAAASSQESLPLVWKPLFQGIESAECTLSKPRPIKMQLLKINLKAKGISFLSTPGNGEKKGETDGLKTSTFLKKYQLQAAINAAPYAPVPFSENGPENVSGLAISEGTEVSPFSEKENSYPALIVTKMNVARIEHAPFGDLKDAWNVVSGFQIILKDGAVVATDKVLHPRTAVGIARGGAELIWMVVDGRQKEISEGATTLELGGWLKIMGCTDGINLDGGGTSTLVVEDENKNAKILNVPIHLGVSGMERVAGSHLGVRALPLKN